MCFRFGFRQIGSFNTYQDWFKYVHANNVNSSLLVPHRCVREWGQYWVRYWLVAFSYQSIIKPKGAIVDWTLTKEHTSVLTKLQNFSLRHKQNGRRLAYDILDAFCIDIAAQYNVPVIKKTDQLFAMNYSYMECDATLCRQISNKYERFFGVPWKYMHISWLIQYAQSLAQSVVCYLKTHPCNRWLIVKLRTWYPSRSLVG